MRFTLFKRYPYKLQQVLRRKNPGVARQVIFSTRQGQRGYVWRSRILLLPFAVGMMFQSGQATPTISTTALPNNGSISAGIGNISQSGNTLTIQQTTPQLAINWGSFNIGSQAGVIFQQPSASASALNRINSTSPSVINGSLQANGQIFLLNPSGVIFGQSARVDVGGLIASSLNLSDADYLAGKYHFTSNGSAGLISNQGTLVAHDGGYILLLGPQVQNSGTIESPNGKINLSAGQNVSVALDPEGLLNVEVDAAVINALVQNSGTLKAEGGVVQLSAQALNTLTNGALNQTVIDQSGTIQTHTAGKTGTIAIDGGSNGVVSIGGTLDASASTPGSMGGSMSVTGQNIALLDNSLINASAPAGGGDIFIGGNWHGQGPLAHAQAVWVSPTASIQADATSQGHGGQVVLWSDDYTAFYGNISARGGAQGGNGGQVETSSHGVLDVFGNVDAAAFKGRAGSWLLDPANVTIASSGASGSAFAGTPNPYTYNPTGGSTILASAISTALGLGDVTINTASGAGGNGDINVNASVSGTAGSLTLNAVRNITLASGVGITLSGAGNSITMNAAGAGGQASATAGQITLNNSNALSTNHGNIALNAGTLTTPGVVSLNSATLSSNGGDITLSNMPSAAGGAGSTSGSSQGVYLFNTTLNAGGGNILMMGQGPRSGPTPANDFGVIFDGNNTVTTAGAGAITMIADGGTVSASVRAGGFFNTGLANISTADGNIDITAIGNASGLAGKAAFYVIASATGLNIYSNTGSIGLTAISNVSNALAIYFPNQNGLSDHIGWNGSGAGTTGNITIQAADAGNNSGVNLSGLAIKTNGGSLKLGAMPFLAGAAGTSASTGLGLGGFTIPNTLIASGSIINNLSIGGVNNYGGITVNQPFGQGTLAGNTCTGGNCLTGSVTIENGGLYASGTNTVATPAVLSPYSTYGTYIYLAAPITTQNQPLAILAGQAVPNPAGQTTTYSTAPGNEYIYANLSSGGGDITLSNMNPITGAGSSNGYIGIAIGSSPSSTYTTVVIDASNTAANSGGNITINGASNTSLQGIELDYTTLRTLGAGAINLLGKADSGGQKGLLFYQGAVDISTENGDINLLGAAVSDQGFYINNATNNYISSVSGDITVKALTAASGLSALGSNGNLYIGWTGAGAGTTGHVTIQGQDAGGAAGMNLSNIFLKTQGGALTIGSTGNGLGNLTIPNGLIADSSIESAVTIGDAGTYGTLTLNQPIGNGTYSSGTQTCAGGNCLLGAATVQAGGLYNNAPFSNGGSIIDNVPITTNNQPITLLAGSAVPLTPGGNVYSTGTGGVRVEANLTSNGGDITIENGSTGGNLNSLGGPEGGRVNNVIVDASTPVLGGNGGDIVIAGTAMLIPDGNYSLYVTRALGIGNSTIKTNGLGTITMSGVSGTDPAYGQGGLAIVNSTISATNGAITLTGTAQATSVGGIGGQAFQFDNTTISSTTGNITLTGISTLQSETPLSSSGATISSTTGHIAIYAQDAGDAPGTNLSNVQVQTAGNVTVSPTGPGVGNLTLPVIHSANNVVIGGPNIYGGLANNSPITATGFVLFEAGGLYGGVATANGGSIFSNSAITTNNQPITLLAGSAVPLTPGGNVYSTGTGGVSVGANLTSNGGDITIENGSTGGNLNSLGNPGGAGVGNAIVDASSPVLGGNGGNIVIAGTAMLIPDGNYYLYVTRALGIGNSTIKTNGLGTITMSGVSGTDPAYGQGGLAIGNSTISTTNGAITLTGTAQATSVGGIGGQAFQFDNTTISSTTGNITLTGISTLPGETPFGSSGATISSTTGHITIYAQDAGDGPGTNLSNVQVQTAGNVTVGATGSGMGNIATPVINAANHVLLGGLNVYGQLLTSSITASGPVDIEAGGEYTYLSNPPAGCVTGIICAANGASPYGGNVYVNGSITTTGQPITILAGQAVANSIAPGGMHVGGGLNISSNGGAIKLSNIDVNGNGSTVGFDNGRGVAVGFGNLTTIDAGGGNIDLSATASTNGVDLNNAALITAGSGTITLTGVGDGGGWGVPLNNATITTVDGNITINGTVLSGNGYAVGTYGGTSQILATGVGNITLTGVNHGSERGIYLADTTVGGNGTGTGNITLSGTGATNGVDLSNTSLMTAGVGTITLTGVGGGGGWGVPLNNATITTVDGDITINGTVLSGNGHAVGTYGGTNQIIATGSGNITLTGTNNDSGAGIYLANTTVGGNGTGTGHILLTGTSTGHGIQLDGSDTLATTGNGTIQIVGTGGDCSWCWGIPLGGAFISTTDGDITITGINGGNNPTFGTYNGSNTIQTTHGNILVTAIARGLGIAVMGQPSGSISFQSDSGNITLLGEDEGQGGGMNLGNGTISTNTGNVSIQSLGSGVGGITAPAIINAHTVTIGDLNTYNQVTTASINATGPVVVEAGGGYINPPPSCVGGCVPGGSSEGDVYIGGSITTTAQPITILAGQAVPTSTAVGGVQIGGGLSIATSGADITISNVDANTGVGSTGGFDGGRGVAVGFGNLTTIDAGGGHITISGEGLSGNSGNGIDLNNAALMTAGSGAVTLTGATNGGYGIALNNAAITTVDGDIVINGTVLSGNGHAVGTYGGTNQIIATGSGNTTLTGTNNDSGAGIYLANTTAGGNGTGTGYIALTGTSVGGNGIELGGSDTLATTGAGTITITGTTSANMNGLLLGGNGDNLFSTQDGAIAVNGTTTGSAGYGIWAQGNNALNSVHGAISVTAIGATQALGFQNGSGALNVGWDGNAATPGTTGDVSIRGQDDGTGGGIDLSHVVIKVDDSFVYIGSTGKGLSGGITLPNGSIADGSIERGVQIGDLGTGPVIVNQPIGNGTYQPTTQTCPGGGNCLLGLAKILAGAMYNGAVSTVSVGDIQINAPITAQTIDIEAGSQVSGSIAAGSIVLDHAALQSHGGTITLSASNGITVTNSPIDTGGGSLNLTNTTNGAMTFDSASSINLDNGVLNFSGVDAGDAINSAISGTGGELVKAGSGTLTLTGTNSYTGGTTVDAGILIVGNGSALGSGAATVHSGTLAVIANQTVNNDITLDGGSLSLGGGDILNGDVTLNSSPSVITDTGAPNPSDIIHGTLSGPGSLIKDGGGTLTLTGARIYRGGTFVRSGNLVALGMGIDGALLFEIYHGSATPIPAKAADSLSATDQSSSDQNSSDTLPVFCFGDLGLCDK